MQDTKDFGPEPYVANIEDLTKQNTLFRIAKWTGTNLQMTLMSLEPGDDVGLEVHNDHDQFLRIEAGTAKVVMGSAENQLDKEWTAEDDWAIFVPAGTWHNIINTGDTPLKLYSIYAPAEHSQGTIHRTKEDANAAEAEGHNKS